MSEPQKDLIVTLTVPTGTDEQISVKVTASDDQTITQSEVVYYLFQTATSIMSHMSDREHAATIKLIEEFFE